jgi:hypothetical protein
LLRESTNLMVLRVVDGHFPVDIDGYAAGGGKMGVANFALRSEAGWNAKIGGPPIRLGRPCSYQKAWRSTLKIPMGALTLRLKRGRGDKIRSLRISADNQLHNASTLALSALLNMSEIMIAPPAIHCPEPPNSGWLNCAMPPRPAIIENSIEVSAS